MADACCILDASNHHHSERAFQLAQMSDEAFAALIDKEVSSAPPYDSSTHTEHMLRLKYRLCPWGWSYQWHTLVGRDNRGFSSAGARVNAVLHLDAELRRWGAMLETLPQSIAHLFMSGWDDLHLWGLICEGHGPSLWSTLEYLLGNGGFSSSGACCNVCNSNAVADSKLMTCAGCGVPKYCSKECQRAGWKSGHKKMCKELKAIVATGEGLA